MGVEGHQKQSERESPVVLGQSLREWRFGIGGGWPISGLDKDPGRLTGRQAPAIAGPPGRVGDLLRQVAVDAEDVG